MLRWTVSDWTACSRSCGTAGFRTRTVGCVRQVAGPTRVEVLEASQCRGKRPENRRRCRLQHCPARWLAERWTQVSQRKKVKAIYSTLGLLSYYVVLITVILMYVPGTAGRTTSSMPWRDEELLSRTFSRRSSVRFSSITAFCLRSLIT